jgi:plastocyanin
MTIMRTYFRVGFVLILFVAVALTLPRIVSSREDARTVTLVVRNMTYYLEGNDTPNPSLTFAAGEQVRLTLRNEDPGMSHDFTIRPWSVSTKILDGKGQDTVTFRVPSGSEGPASYTCTPHSAMMSGRIVVGQR